MWEGETEETKESDEYITKSVGFLVMCRGYEHKKIVFFLTWDNKIIDLRERRFFSSRTQQEWRRKRTHTANLSGIAGQKHRKICSSKSNISLLLSYQKITEQFMAQTKMKTQKDKVHLHKDSTYDYSKKKVAVGREIDGFNAYQLILALMWDFFLPKFFLKKEKKEKQNSHLGWYNPVCVMNGGWVWWGGEEEGRRGGGTKPMFLSSFILGGSQYFGTCSFSTCINVCFRESSILSMTHSMLCLFF